MVCQMTADMDARQSRRQEMALIVCDDFSLIKLALHITSYTRLTRLTTMSLQRLVWCSGSELFSRHSLCLNKRLFKSHC